MDLRQHLSSKVGPYLDGTCTPRRTRVIAVLVALLAPCTAQAQSGYDPRAAEQKFVNEPNDQRAARRASVPIARPGFAKAAADTKVLFNLKRVSVSGANAIAPAEIENAYRQYLGRGVSQADLSSIAEALSDAYRAAGFHLSRAIVPPQDIRGGRVKVSVIEGRIAELVVKGDDADTFGVRRLLDPVLTEAPSRLATLERQLLLANDLPGVRVADTVLEEIGSASGNFRLTVVLKSWRIYTSSGVDNLGSASVGPWQSYSTIAANSYFVRGDTLTANFSAVPSSRAELSLGRLSYDAPIGIDGARVGASALYSDVRPGDGRRQFDTRTQTESFELRGSIVPLKSQRHALTLTAAAGWSDVRSTDIYGLIYHDHIRTVGLLADYQLKDDFGGTSYVTVGWRQGLGIFGASPASDPYLSHYGASGEFATFNLAATRIQALSDAWSMKLTGAAQAASAPLLTSQQFYLGGAAFGRGYGSGEASGDNGVAGAFELRFDQSLNYTWLKGYQLYGFLEGGTVWNDGFAPRDGLSLASIGAGVRVHLTDDLQAGVGVAFPIDYRSPDNPERHARILFSLSNAFKLCPDKARLACS
jgi:hemolysin activation/secretion protein